MQYTARFISEVYQILSYKKKLFLVYIVSLIYKKISKARWME